jgi:hypothetical protein
LDVVKGIFEPTKKDRKIYEDMSVVILTPCGGYQSAFKFVKSAVNLVAYSWLHGLKVYQMGGTERMVVHWARNELARAVRGKINEYTGKPFTHVLWLDDDHVFNPDLALYLARHKDLDVVSALYFGRTEKHLPVVYVKDDNADPYKHYPLIEVPPNLCEVDAVGFGACLMRIDVLDRVPEPWFKFNECGEDIYFCVHAKRAGVRIWCDGSYMLGHIGDPQIVTHDTYRRYLAANSETFKDRIKVPLGGGSWLKQSGQPEN